MTLIMPREPIEDAIGIIIADHGFIEGKELTERDIRNVRIAMTEGQIEPLLRVLLEHVLLSDRLKDYERLDDNLDEDIRPVLLELHEALFGPLPSGPAPSVRYVSVFDNPEMRKRYAEPGWTYNDWPKIWARMREDLYGPTPYNYDELRRRAMEPATATDDR